MKDFNKFIHLVQTIYNTTDFIPLHEPRFRGNEKKQRSGAQASVTSTRGSSWNAFCGRARPALSTRIEAVVSPRASLGGNCTHPT